MGPQRGTRGRSQGHGERLPQLQSARWTAHRAPAPDSQARGARRVTA